jgi:hypothetical protein
MPTTAEVSTAERRNLIAANHSPGPWTLYLSDRRDRPHRITDADGLIVATVFLPMRSDARLIAQAPAGYALARHIVAMADDAYLGGHPEFDAIVDEARALISAVEAA